MGPIRVQVIQGCANHVLLLGGGIAKKICGGGGRGKKYGGGGEVKIIKFGYKMELVLFVF